MGLGLGMCVGLGIGVELGARLGLGVKGFRVGVKGWGGC